MALEAYPLCWPSGWKRIPAGQRVHGKFSRGERQYSTYGGNTSSYLSRKYLTVSDGLQRVLSELQKMGVDRQDVIISTNVPTRLDGLPRSGVKEPDDPGAAAYWQRPGEPMRCMAIDRYSTVADNLAAIAATLDAMRAIERHGGAEILDRAFTGFAALPASTVEPNWWDVLQVSSLATVEEIQAAYKLRARTEHPDGGGSHERMALLNMARDRALAERNLAR